MRRVMMIRCPKECGVWRSASKGSVLKRTHHLAVEAVDGALASQRDEFHRARLSGLETHGCAGDDVQPEAARALAIEFERGVDFVEVKMRADLHRTVACIRDG